jgi:hypothetical protein
MVRTQPPGVDRAPKMSIAHADTYFFHVLEMRVSEKHSINDLCVDVRVHKHFRI